MTDLQRLRRAILVDPSDDVARLAYADALEEAGDESRAEFIRLQVELWRRNQPAPVAGSVLGGPTVALHDAQDGLARHNGWWWLGNTLRGEILGKCKADGPPTLWVARDADGEAEFRRGLVWRVAMPLGRFMFHAAQLFADHPIAEVTLTDRVPLHQGGLTDPFIWVGTAHTAANAHGLPYPFLASEPRSFVRLPSRRHADAWLSVRAVAHGRGLAGLPPLPQPARTP